MSKFEHIDLQDALESYMVYDHDVNRPDEEYTADLEEDFPVRRLFQIHKTPDGFPPKNIRNMWVGLQLPVRALVTSLEVPVLGIDALATL